MPRPVDQPQPRPQPERDRPRRTSRQSAVDTNALQPELVDAFVPEPYRGTAIDDLPTPVRRRALRMLARAKDEGQLPPPEPVEDELVD